jgi:uncharacterized protein YebE (UPF0316 family)
MTIITLVVYFCVGVIQDFFFTMNLRYVAKEKVLLAVIFSFLTVAMSMLVLYNIVKDIDISSGVLAIIVYSCGIAGGTYIAMKIPGLKNK